MKKIKTFRLGEHADYGIWKVILKNDRCFLVGCDYESGEIKEQKSFAQNNLDAIHNFLWDITTPFYAENIYGWILQNAEAVA
jgi:hypothetical protein